MRTPILTALCLLGTASIQVHAQDTDDDAAAMSETEGAEVVDTPAAPNPKLPPGKDMAPGEVHTVVKGDTLWMLSQRVLGSPWYWPKVWSYNPEIANPHWIYPGNQVKFFPSGEGGPGRIDVSMPSGSGSGAAGAAGEAGAAGAEDDDADGTGFGALEDGDSPDQISLEDDDGTVSAAGPLVYQSKPSMRVVSDGFVTPKDVEEAGMIKASFIEGDMLTMLDEVYLTFKNKHAAKIGERYVIFRSMGSINHPRKSGKVGYITKLLGTVRVTRITGEIVTGVIEQALDDIQRGDLLGPAGEKLAENVLPQPNRVDLDAYVVGALTPTQTLYGEHYVIIVDRGSADGVMPGNTFTLFRQGDRGGDFLDPSQGQDTQMPVEDIGACLALDVKERASTCIMTRSLREIVAGDRAVMRLNKAPVAQR